MVLYGNFDNEDKKYEAGISETEKGLTIVQMMMTRRAI